MLVFALLVLVRYSRRQPVWLKIRPRLITLTTMMTIAVGPVSSSLCLSQEFSPNVSQNFSRGFGDPKSGQESQDPSPNDNLLVDAPAENQQILREGTRIPPTVGRIIPIGRRWGFAPDKPELMSAISLRTTDRTFQQTAPGLRHKPRPTRLGAATIMVTGPDLPRAATSVRELPNEEELAGEEVKIQHLILTENLMLQRIVDAITDDSSDDRWTISGEITEFRNQNRLMIRTAQRANAD